MSFSALEAASFVKLYEGNIIPLRVILACLTWVIHDYFVTLKDEIKYIWPQKFGTAKFMFLWIRYYTIVLLILDVIQIHIFTLKAIPKDTLCLIMDPATRVAGAVSLWMVEIIMQLRIYALYRCSKKVAIFNGVLFCLSIVAFIAIMVPNAIARKQSIAMAVKLPLPGCPAINTGNQWLLWIPATTFEVVLFGFAAFKTIKTWKARYDSPTGMSLYIILIKDNILYFFCVTSILVFNTMMSAGVTRIPWFSYGPFYAAVSIVTTRMLLHLRKYALDGHGNWDTKKIDQLAWGLSPIQANFPETDDEDGESPSPVPSARQIRETPARANINFDVELGPEAPQGLLDLT
ncbi:hypothetical protein BDQ17DRAFT_1302128 [Cyathus striatus]|nr:hypothetical protein BDQ17DRAFT_1302128 [Cyathus striatus]